LHNWVEFLNEEDTRVDQIAKAKELFLDDLDLSGYLDTFSFIEAKDRLLKSLQNGDTALHFLLGDPGCGKSFLLNYINQRTDSIKIIKFFHNPYFSDKEFLSEIIKQNDSSLDTESMGMQEMIKELQKKYKNLEYTVLVDEAQLLTERHVELFRILGDLKIFKIVMAMHTKEGEYVLSKMHFNSRSITIIKMLGLKKEEIKRYVENRLLQDNLSTLASEFKPSYFSIIHRYSKGNFRLFKKIVRSAFEIVETAQNSNYKKYDFISKDTLIMAAIDTGCIDVK
jgi:type II secretory pathway predicted ATPase ExeA